MRAAPRRPPRWLADRGGPVPVLVTALAAVATGATVQAFTPPLALLGTIAFLAMAAALGAASGAVFALVAVLAPPDKVGSVTGVVGAAAGLGGFVPPLVMSFVYGQFHSYAAGLAASPWLLGPPDPAADTNLNIDKFSHMQYLPM